MTSCGGCEGRGAHRRYCPRVVGPYASRLGDEAQRLESVGDMIGPNDKRLSSAAWSLASGLEAHAAEAAEAWRARNPDAPRRDEPRDRR